MSSVEDRTDWLRVARTANEWAAVTRDVKQQVRRDYQIGKITPSEWMNHVDDMEQAWKALHAEWSVAMSLHAVEQLGGSYDAFVADLRHEHQ